MIFYAAQNILKNLFVKLVTRFCYAIISIFTKQRKITSYLAISIFKVIFRDFVVDRTQRSSL